MLPSTIHQSLGEMFHVSTTGLCSETTIKVHKNADIFSLLRCTIATNVRSLSENSILGITVAVRVLKIASEQLQTCRMPCVCIFYVSDALAIDIFGVTLCGFLWRWPEVCGARSERRHM